MFLKDGDYRPDGKGGFLRVTGAEELLQRVLFKLTARRGGFPLMPQLGSRLFELPRHKESQWGSLARQFVTEALADETELSVEDVRVIRSGEGISATVSLNYRGEMLEMTLEV